MGRVTERVRRTPVADGGRNILRVSGKKGDYEYRIVNDVGDRIADFESRGYEIVCDNDVRVGDRRIANPTKEGSPVKVSVGGGVQAYLMRQKKEFYDEDQRDKQAYVDKSEEAMKADAREKADYGKITSGDRE